MNFLVDNALSPSVAEGLTKAGHGAVHVRDLDLGAAPDEIVFQRALAESRILISADTDFGNLLKLSQSTAPSLILFRGGVERRPRQQIELLLKNLPRLRGWLTKGAIVIVEPDRIRIRELPL